MIESSPAVVHLYRQLPEAVARGDSLDLCARLILAIFDDFYAEHSDCPYRAQRAFERMDPKASVALSHERLNLYSEYVLVHGQRIGEALPRLSREEELWEALDERYRTLIVARYEADIAFAFAQSIRRNVFHGLWRPVSYTFPRPVGNRARALASAHQRFELEHGIESSTLVAVLHAFRFRAPFRDLHGDVERILERWRTVSAAREQRSGRALALDVLEGGFFRDLTAFVVGRVEWSDGSRSPFVLALLNGTEGIWVDALLHETSDVHNLFTSTLANFHVTSDLYFQIAKFLSSLMPLRPLGLHYSTIGFNHVGKVAILDEVEKQLEKSGQRFASSPGADGTVAIGFTFEACTYHFKVIRDRPTRDYKWGEFAGTEAVLAKYRQVHEINRTGSMLDNVMYFSLRLERERFDPALLEDLAANAAGSVQVGADYVLFRPLIVQLKITPLPVFFARADDATVRADVVENLGHCIRNNLAAGIFNKDLDARNYGVGRYGKVFLFDYDAIENLADVTIASNSELEEGEEDVPDWFFADGHVFLPEELVTGLQFPDRDARRRFRQRHAELETLEFWRDAQERLKRGEVLGVKNYPDARRLEPIAREEEGATPQLPGTPSD